MQYDSEILSASYIYINTSPDTNVILMELYIITKYQDMG